MTELGDDSVFTTQPCRTCGESFTREKWLLDNPRYNQCNRCFNQTHWLQKDVVPHGWWPLVSELAKKLDGVSPGYRIAQIKEKFGGLRFYADEITYPGRDLVKEAESASHKICIQCGAPGKTYTSGWWQTLCPAHATQFGKTDTALE